MFDDQITSKHKHVIFQIFLVPLYVEIISCDKNYLTSTFRALQLVFRQLFLYDPPYSYKIEIFKNKGGSDPPMGGSYVFFRGVPDLK